MRKESRNVNEPLMFENDLNNSNIQNSTLRSFYHERNNSSMGGEIKHQVELYNSIIEKTMDSEDAP